MRSSSRKPSDRNPGSVASRATYALRRLGGPDASKHWKSFRHRPSRLAGAEVTPPAVYASSFVRIHDAIAGAETPEQRARLPRVLRRLRRSRRTPYDPRRASSTTSACPTARAATRRTGAARRQPIVNSDRRVVLNACGLHLVRTRTPRSLTGNPPRHRRDHSEARTGGGIDSARNRPRLAAVGASHNPSPPSITGKGEEA